jgi:hypothetical protein
MDILDHDLRVSWNQLRDKQVQIESAEMELRQAAEKVERGRKSATEKLLALRKLLRAGHTTGDPVLDFSLMFCDLNTGDFAAVRKYLEGLFRCLAKNKLKTVVIVYRESHYPYPSDQNQVRKERVNKSLSFLGILDPAKLRVEDCVSVKGLRLTFSELDQARPKSRICCTKTLFVRPNARLGAFENKDERFYSIRYGQNDQEHAHRFDLYVGETLFSPEEIERVDKSVYLAFED